MNIKEAINQAIGAHGLWKQELRSAIDTGTFKTPATVVAMDNQCAFGKWLYSLDAKAKASPRFASVKAAHAEFHREAAAVLTLASQGKKTEANASLAPKGRFFDTSSKLTVEMMSWKNEAA